MVLLGAEVIKIDSELRVSRPIFPLSLCLTYYSIDQMCLAPCLKSVYPFKEVHSVLLVIEPYGLPRNQVMECLHSGTVEWIASWCMELPQPRRYNHSRSRYYLYPSHINTSEWNFHE